MSPNPFYPVSISGAQQKEKYLFSLRSQRLCGEMQSSIINRKSKSVPIFYWTK